VVGVGAPSIACRVVPCCQQCCPRGEKPQGYSKGGLLLLHTYDTQLRAHVALSPVVSVMSCSWGGTERQGSSWLAVSGYAGTIGCSAHDLPGADRQVCEEGRPVDLHPTAAWEA
jgi:hypothetical protein